MLKKVFPRRSSLVLLCACFLLAAWLIPISSILKVSATQWTGLDYPRGVAIGDYDNDGQNDLAISELNAGKVTVYKNDGVTVIRQWTSLTTPSGVAIGDFDNDGLNDIAITLTNAGAVSVVNSSGSVIETWVGCDQPTGVAIGDYDNDGLNELAIAEYSPGKVTVYEDDGFTISEQWTGLYAVASVAIGDYDNDGYNDLAFTEFNPSRVTVYRNDGVTVIHQWTFHPTLDSPYAVAIGDYDNDGLNDLAFSNNLRGNVSIYNSAATEIRQLKGLDKPKSVAIGDYDNDGLIDLVVAESSVGTNNGVVTVYYGLESRKYSKVPEPTIVTLEGMLTNTTGYPIQSGSIRVTIVDHFGAEVWQETFDDVIDNGRYNMPLGTPPVQPTLRLIRGNIYGAILEVDADSPTFVTVDVVFGDNSPAGDLIKFVAD